MSAEKEPYDAFEEHVTDEIREEQERVRAVLMKFGRRIPISGNHARLPNLSVEAVKRIMDVERNNAIYEQCARDGRVWSLSSLLLEDDDVLKEHWHYD